jgi:hypothetical protein
MCLSVKSSRPGVQVDPGPVISAAQHDGDAAGSWPDGTLPLLSNVATPLAWPFSEFDT